MRKHLVIPDCQITPHSPTDHLGWIGEFIVEKKPDVIACLGDFADMESLSKYDVGTMKHEGKRYAADIAAANAGMSILMMPTENYNAIRRRDKKKKYDPEKHLFLGNHEFRIYLAIMADPKMEGAIGFDDFNFVKFGWNVHPFKEVVEIDGVHYSHFFYNKQSGRPYTGQAETRLKNIGFTFVQGHQQVYVVGVRDLNNGDRHRCLVCGSCYLHDEEYRGPQANSEWRGVFLLHEVHNGDYVLNEVSLNYLCRKYEKKSLWAFMERKYPEIFRNSLWLKRQKAAEVQNG